MASSDGWGEGPGGGSNYPPFRVVWRPRPARWQWREEPHIRRAATARGVGADGPLHEEEELASQSLSGVAVTRRVVLELCVSHRRPPLSGGGCIRRDGTSEAAP